ncbi:MAG: hypothetical protein E7384_00165 [Ruminococcaceae bacterium]|nr:hypothetical protein [Oscillospiraceae bacterium]
MKSKFVKILSVMLVLVLLLCSCGEDKPKNDPTDAPVITETVLPTETVEATEEATKAPTVAPTETAKATATTKPTATQTAKPTPTVAPTPTPDPYAKNTYTIKPNLSSIKLVGRTTMVGNYVSCDWSASGIEFKADCKGTVKLKIKGDGGQHNCGYFSVYIDGVKQTNRVQVSTSGTKEVTIATNLKAGEHTFRFLKQTFVKHAKFTIQSITMNGTLAKEAPAQQKYYMEVIGDSITSGHGILEKNGNPSSFDATSAYAFLAAETLKADYSIVSVDGIGVTKGYQTETMPQVYPYTCWYRNTTKKYTSDRQANVVVINLGTNDATHKSNTTTYINDVKTLIGQVRAIYKDVPIVWVYNSMRADYNEHTKTAIDALGGESAGIYMLKFTANTAGGNGHPSAAAHVTGAKVLSDFIKSKGFMK